MSIKLLTIALFFFTFHANAESKIKIQVLPSVKTLENCDPNPGSCRVIDQSGSIEPWECRNSDRGNIRCYADVEYQNGTRLRLWGSCVGSYSDCWSSDSVDPCD